VLAEGRAIGQHHIAFLRAWFQNIDLRKAWDRYLAFTADSSDARVIERTRNELLRAVLAAGHQADRSRPEFGLKQSLDLITLPPFTPSTAPIPSLDDWIASEGVDPDLSQAEQLEMYREHYGLDAVARGDEPASVSSTQVQALNRIAAVISRPPSPTDRVALWLSPGIAAAIQAAGAPTLERLVGMINLYGYRWYRPVPGLGERRARAIAQWLAGQDPPLPVTVRESALSPPQRQAALRAAIMREVVAPPRFAIVPLERLQVPPELLGRQGTFRARTANTLGAVDDVSALRSWLSRYVERAHTSRAYRKEVERFFLWCLIVARKPLSSIDSADCQAYRRFLSALPADWIQSRTVGRDDPGWRPFRGPLQPSSQKQALVIVQAMFEGLQRAGYLVANPMAAVMKGFDLPAGGIRIERSLTQAEWAFVLGFARAEPPCAEQRRTLLTLELLVSTGLRLDELAGASLGALSRVAVDGEAAQAWVLRVVGKRRKTRDVPLADEVVDLLRAHHQDLAANGVAFTPASPLLGKLASAPGRWAPQGTSRTQLIRPPPQGALSAAGIYRALKRFFRRAAREAGASGLDPERLGAASTHWLRHTFGRQAIAADVPTDVVQQALGHESLATTGIYVTTERSRMIRELRRARAAQAD
jgi:site-specific recombinase XerD